MHTCFAKYFETHLLEVVNGCCVEDEFESKPVLVFYGLWEDTSDKSYKITGM